MVKRSQMPKDQRGPHIRVYWELFDSNAWRCLTAVDQRAYMALARAMTSTGNGDLSLPLTRAKPCGIKSTATLAKSLRALVAVGLIAVTRSGGCTRDGQRLPTLYRLTEYQCYEVPKKMIEAHKATNDWKAVTTLGNGRERIRQAEKQAAEKHSEKLKSHVQKLNHTASKIEPVSPLIGSKIEPWPPYHGSKNEPGESPPTVEKASNGNDFKKIAAAQLSEGHGSKIKALCIVARHTTDSGQQCQAVVAPAANF